MRKTERRKDSKPRNRFTKLTGSVYTCETCGRHA